MNQSFYTAAIGASSQQKRLNVYSNNIANVNTYGYKSKTPAFTDLMYYEMKGKTDPDNRLQTGTGVKVSRTETDFSGSVLTPSGQKYDYGIQGSGFFMLRNLATGEISYTRDGSFSVGQNGDDFYLITATGKVVLDQNQNPIIIGDQLPGELNIGVFDFVHKNGMLSVGDNEFVPIEKNGQPFLKEDAVLSNGMIEGSNVDFANEMTKVIESQRAYSYALKMVQTSDEITNTINTLR